VDVGVEQRLEARRELRFGAIERGPAAHSSKASTHVTMNPIMGRG
jgi:hypothetical protein